MAPRELGKSTAHVKWTRNARTAMAGTWRKDPRAQGRGHSRENILNKAGKVYSNHGPWEDSKGHSIYQGNRMCAGEGNANIAEKLSANIFCRSGMMGGETFMVQEPLLVMPLIRFQVNLSHTETFYTKQQDCHNYHNGWQAWVEPEKPGL